MLRPWRRGGHRDPGADTVLSIPPTLAPTETAGHFGVQKGIPHHFPKEKGAAAHQGAGQPHHLGSEVLDGQVVLQYHAHQDGLQLWDAGAWGRGGRIQILDVPHYRGGILGSQGGRGAAGSPPECGVMLWEKPVEKAARAVGYRVHERYLSTPMSPISRYSHVWAA